MCILMHPAPEVSMARKALHVASVLLVTRRDSANMMNSLELPLRRR